jgi:hypothetical protein
MFILVIMIASVPILVATCGGCADSKRFCSEKGCFDAQPYGIFDSENKREGVQYKVSVGNVILSIIFSETLLIPAILCGWYLWEPVGLEAQ